MVSVRYHVGRRQTAGTEGRTLGTLPAMSLRSGYYIEVIGKEGKNKNGHKCVKIQEKKHSS